MTLATRRRALFPDTTKIENDALAIGGHALASLAEAYGTPLYVFDRSTMDACVERYKRSLESHYPAPSFITYAGKAFLCTAIAQWARQLGLWVDCTGQGELVLARAGNVAPSNLVMHGANKSEADLHATLEHASTIVVDSLSELAHFGRALEAARTAGFAAKVPSVWLRLQPGSAVRTHHAHTQTGQVESKFGMTPEEIVEAAKLCKESDLPVGGLHFHQGSNFREPAPLVAALELAVGLAAEIGFGDRWHLSPGGGWGVAYHEDELPQPDIDDYVRLIARETSIRCRSHKVSLPILHLEPGRSLVARAGVAIYRVGTVKRRKDRTWLLVDGGMADNPRFALYGARYSCLPVSGLSREFSERISIAGPYCESGDIIVQDLQMPRIEEGELLAVPVSGAYHLSMASNYNGARRPAAIWLEAGRSRLIIRRESLGELSQRDLSIA
jgi:diaminopimelate decarboxylase